MNYDNTHSWDFCPHVFLHLKQIYIGLRKHGERHSGNPLLSEHIVRLKGADSCKAMLLSEYVCHVVVIYIESSLESRTQRPTLHSANPTLSPWSLVYEDHMEAGLCWGLGSSVILTLISISN